MVVESTLSERKFKCGNTQRHFGPPYTDKLGYCVDKHHAASPKPW